MVRPEVRTLHDALATSGWRTESLEVLAPGEALVEFLGVLAVGILFRFG